MRRGYRPGGPLKWIPPCRLIPGIGIAHPPPISSGNRGRQRTHEWRDNEGEAGAGFIPGVLSPTADSPGAKCGPWRSTAMCRRAGHHHSRRSERQNDAVHAVPDEYPRVTAATFKQLYGTAFRCAYPDCRKPLFRVHDETGDRILNSRIAHIHARRRGGPRWIPMDPEENRSDRNLILACLEHADEIDNSTLADRYPATLLREWKQKQIEEYERIQRSWPLTDVEADELAVATAAGSELTAAAVAEVARAVSRLISRAKECRQRAGAEIALWQRTFNLVRAQHLAWDAETGERIYAEPAPIETDRHRRSVEAALQGAHAELAPLVETLKAEVAAVRSTSVDLHPWCDFVDRSAAGTLVAATTWPAPPPFEDSEVFEDSLLDLQRAAEGLSARWRGEEVPKPMPPPTPGPTQEDEEVTAFREHQNLLDEARRFSRVKTLPYDGALAMKVFEATEFAARIPPVWSLLPYALPETARLVANIGRNAGDGDFSELIDRCVSVAPIRGVYVGRQLQKVGKEETRARLEESAQVAVREILDSIEWSDTAVWEDAEVYGGELLAMEAAETSAESTCDRLNRALRDNPQILLPLIRACSEWIEHRDSKDWSPLGFSRRYSGLAAWFPTSSVVTAIRQALPHVTPLDEPRGRTRDLTDEDLAAQILYQAGLGG